MTTYDLRAEEGLCYPTDYGTHYLIIDDAADPSEQPCYAGETDSLELALLFAASPDLLAACEAAGEIIERDNAEGADRWALWAQLDAAIKKAKGESGD